VTILIVVYRVKATAAMLGIVRVEQVPRPVLYSACTACVSDLLAAVACHYTQLDVIVIILVVLADT
jgi:hypothetical protein